MVGGRFGHKERALGINETWIRRDVWLRHSARRDSSRGFVFPHLSDRPDERPLRKRRLPGFLGDLLRPLMSTLQVSFICAQTSPRVLALR
jgi:hypothetical protein